jgi:glycosyltransferase involved in cell wall biosynthesis
MPTATAAPKGQLDLTLFVPAFNEDKNIANTLASLSHVLSAYPGKTAEILVIDDGSTDRTAEIVSRISQSNPSVALLRNGSNLGLGASLRLAIARSAGRQLLIVPGDNDMPSATIIELIRHSGRADMVMCFFVNRELRGWKRNLLSTLFGLLYSTSFDIYPQYINGPSIYPVHYLKEMRLISTRFSIVAEINVKLLRQGVTFMEVASYRQVGLAGSSSFSLRNLWETGAVFFRLLYEVHVKNPKKYAKRPVRVIQDSAD